MTETLPVRYLLLLLTTELIWSQLCGKPTGNTFRVFHTPLVVKDSIKADTSLESILEKCGAIVRFFHHSSKASDKLKEVQTQLQLLEHRLIQAVETRWNSVFYMLERLSKQRPAVITALCLLGRNTLCLNDEEWSHLSQAIEAFRPF